MAFTLPALPYATDALVPHIDAQTMEIHHGKHHQAYITNLNAATAGTPLEAMTIEQICAGISKHPAAVRNNGGGHFNHSLFWTVMGANAGGNPTGALGEAITKAFGTFDDFKTKFAAAGTTRFGSGWAWLIVKTDGSLAITSTPNQDNPLMDVVTEAERGTPILGLDVWEHAYYLNYQNRRPDYCAAFFNVVNWAEVSKRFEAAHR